MRLSEIPFCSTFWDPVRAVLFAPGVEEAVLDAVFGVRAGFFVGDVAFPGVLAGDFPSDRRDFADALPTRGTEGLLPAFDDDTDNVPAALEREISLLAESLLCLSINGDLVGLGWRPSRGLAGPLEAAGAVLGLADAPVIGCLDVADVLTVVPADVDLGCFDVRLDTVDGKDLTAPTVVLVVVVLALAGLGATFPVLVSPRLVAGFFSADVAAPNLEEAALVVVIFDFVDPTRDEAPPVFAVVAVVVVLDDVVVLVTLLLVLEIPVALVEASSCLGRAGTGFFAGACDGEDIAVVRVVVEVTIFEGDVGAFVAVFVVGFVRRLVVVVVVVVFAFVAAVKTVCIASAVPSCSFSSSVFATISCGLASSSLFAGISSGATCFSGISWTFVDSICAANSSSTCFCAIGALLNNVQDGFIIG